MLEYDPSFDPPAPYVTLQVRNPETAASVSLRGKLDSGASISILPDTTIALLELVPKTTSGLLHSMAAFRGIPHTS